MSDSKLEWQPCFVDPWRGVAHFDGLTIEADPITSARSNRVLPCIVDEQVFFCRMVEALLRSDGAVDPASKRAIDLGTGSGVFALHAASRLGLQVTGVDCCKRAIDFAEHNKRAHKEATGLDLGKRCDFHHVKNWSDSPALFSDLVDFAFLNAPFSPVLKGRTLPLCANGGSDGQTAFRSALSVAAKLLRPQGRLYAVQLLLTDSGGEAKQEILECEDGSWPWSQVRIYPILAEPPITVARFVEGQYRNQTKPDKTHQANSTDDHYSFVFLEFTKGEALPGSTPKLFCRGDVPIKGLPSNWTWPERISWHRAVLENTIEERDADLNNSRDNLSSKNTFPSVSLFLDRSHAPLHRNSESQDPAFTRIQAILDRWVRLNGLLESDGRSSGALFDCIMVESAPWHPAQRQLDLRTQTVIWTRKAPADLDGNCRPPVAQALRRILREIKHIWSQNRSVFRHPDLEELRDSRYWQPAVLHVFSTKDKELIRSINNDKELCGPLPAEQEADEKQPEPNVSRAGNAAAYLHPLRKFDNSEVNRAKKGSLGKCISAALHAYTAICRQENLLEGAPATCCCCLLPLPTPQPRSRDGSSGTLYVYGWSTQQWSPDHETAIADLARAACALYEEEYSEEARREIRRITRNRLVESSSHEIGKALSNIQDGIDANCLALLRDYMTLQLGLSLRGVFLDQFIALKEHPAKGLKDLAALAYMVQQLVPRQFVKEQLQHSQLSAWQAQGEKLLCTSVEDNPDALIALPPESSDAMHFMSAFLAALRNAVAHTTSYCTGDEDPHNRISVVCLKDHLRITNSYQSRFTPEQDYAPYKTKQHRAIDVDEFGTEQVLLYHVSSILPSDTIPDRFQFITKLQSINIEDGMHVHSWQSCVPFDSRFFVSLPYA